MEVVMVTKPNLIYGIINITFLQQLTLDMQQGQHLDDYKPQTTGDTFTNMVWS